MTGRGAWPTSGKGGTLNAKGTGPGSYYVLAAAGQPQVGSGPGLSSDDINVRAVHWGVRAIQKRTGAALNRKVPVDGIFGPVTSQAVIAFQTKVPEKVGKADGIFGPRTAKALLLPLLQKRSAKVNFEDWSVICGLVQNESGWDPGAVGYADEHDLGLAQINRPANPTVSESQCYAPATAFDYAISRFRSAVDAFGGDKRVAIASYNLGMGGARSWSRAGQPDVWDPNKTGKPRYVNAYIDRILTGC